MRLPEDNGNALGAQTVRRRRTAAPGSVAPGSMAPGQVRIALAGILVVAGLLLVFSVGSAFDPGSGPRSGLGFGPGSGSGFGPGFGPGSDFESDRRFGSGFGSVSTVPVRAASVSAAPDNRSGSIALAISSDRQDGPDFIRAYGRNEWSNRGIIDLTDEDRIPPGAVVTGILFTYTRSTGSFAMPERVVVDEGGRRATVNRLSGRTDGHNGKPVHQRWYIQFRTETIWHGPATIWPVVTIQYEY